MEVDSKCRLIVASKYGVQWDGFPCQPRGSIGISPWKGMMKIFHFYREDVRVVVGNAHGMSFWDDIWCGEVLLRHEVDSECVLPLQGGCGIDPSPPSLPFFLGDLV